ncbi:recombinase family protein [Ancylomarina sp. 16SWW S1-10-2]|uniref:recombinase family protein n=1 Tax=Ancylomarina sp. 16SWW S1-10-2 TaxID=2499681 RepID=UPI0012AE0CF4|nr:recombinase family protein [Ancylomarina sp. 16SWW S1-10-2]MRT91654.1 recombinase family protein [Ancylomarina sp. 16SWW S1-10-2]
MKAVVYTRVSTEKQTLERQDTDIKAYAVYKNIEIVKTFSEKMSGSTKTKKRPQFSEMLQFIKLHNIKHLIVSEISRIGRNMADASGTIQNFTDKGICIHSLKETLQTLDEKGNTTPGAAMLIAIYSGVAQTELETLQYRIKSGLKTSKYNHGGQAGHGAYGFKNVNKKLAINHEESEVVKKIYDLYLIGNGTTRIARKLNNEGIQSKLGGTWSDKCVHEILKNSIYTGLRKHNDELIRLPDELTIIEREKYDTVQKILKEKYNKKDVNRKYINIASKLLVCGVCGKGMYMHKRPNNKDNAYKCLSKRYFYKGVSCSNRSVNIDLLNSLLAYHVKHTPAKKIYKSKLSEIKLKLDRLNIRMNKDLKKVERAKQLFINGDLKLNEFEDVKNEVNQFIYKLAEEEELLDDEYQLAVAQDMTFRFFGQDSVPNGPLEAERLKSSVNKVVKEIRVINAPMSKYPQFVRNGLDFVNEIEILNQDGSSKKYLTISRSKLIICNNKIILEKPKPIFI